MPTYEYKCENCGAEFEKFQSITAAPVRRCPTCGKLRVKRLIGTGAGLIFKGSGFYTTDYRSEAYKNAAKSDTAPVATQAKGGDGAAATVAAKPAGEAKSAAELKPAAEPKVAKSSSAKRPVGVK